MIDAWGRTIDYARISITDRCNLRCLYCMPSQGVPAIRHEELLSYEEILRVVRAFASLGIRYIKLTGGEPMARRGCLSLIQGIRQIGGIEEVTMTSNGLLLDGHIPEAAAAGLTALNLSLDTLDAEVFAKITRGGKLAQVQKVLADALACGLNVKINAVPVLGLSDEGVEALAALAKDKPLCVRFIELMPMGCGAGLQPLPPEVIAQRLEAAFGPLIPDASRHGNGPARYVRPQGFMGSIGFISAVSHEFCQGCNRVRLTAEGRLKLCLNHRSGVDLRALLRGGASDEELAECIRQTIYSKPQRHGFGESIDDRELKRMNEIGG